MLFGRRTRRALFILWVGMAMGSLSVHASAQSQSTGTQSQATGTLMQSGYYTKTQDPVTAQGREIRDEQTCKLEPQPPSGTPSQAPNPYCFDPAGITGGAPGWPRKGNYVYVTRINNEEDAAGFAAFDLSEVPFGAAIKSMKMEFQIENESDTGTITPPDPWDPSPLKLCLVTSEWAGGDAGDWSTKPTWDCGTTTPTAKLRGPETVSEPDEAGNPRNRSVVTFSADLMPMAREWAKDRPDYGVVFLASPEAPSDFQVAIRTVGSQGVPVPMLVRVTYDPPPEDQFGFTGGGNDNFFDTSDEVSFGGAEGFTEPQAPAGPFSTPATSPTGVSGPANPTMPWWVWTIIPLGLAGISLFGRVVTADYEPKTERLGPVGKLVDRRAALRSSAT